MRVEFLFSATPLARGATPEFLEASRLTVSYAIAAARRLAWVD